MTNSEDVTIIGCDTVYQAEEGDRVCGSPARWQVEVIGDRGEVHTYYLCTLHKNEYVKKLASRLGRVREL